MILKKVRYTGKWVEFWFDNPWGPYEKCSKGYMLDRCITEADLGHYVTNYGMVGLDLELDENGDPKKLSIPGAIGPNGFEKNTCECENS